ncbi:MAG: hypothetical protein ACXQS8_05900, partial [Candidatus Helarchaeales archaeon]
ESTNKIRVSLGALLGIALSLLQFAFILLMLTDLVVAIFVVFAFGVITYKNYKNYKIPSPDSN